MFPTDVVTDVFSVYCKEDAECPTFKDFKLRCDTLVTERCTCPLGLVPGPLPVPNTCVEPIVSEEKNLVREAMLGSYKLMKKTCDGDDKCCTACFAQLDTKSCHCSDSSTSPAVPLCECQKSSPLQIRCVDLQCPGRSCEIGYVFKGSSCVDIDECSETNLNDCDEDTGTAVTLTLTHG
jgi:hypothetical protein